MIVIIITWSADHHHHHMAGSLSSHLVGLRTSSSDSFLLDLSAHDILHELALWVVIVRSYLGLTAVVVQLIHQTRLFGDERDVIVILYMYWSNKTKQSIN